MADDSNFGDVKGTKFTDWLIALPISLILDLHCRQTNSVLIFPQTAHKGGMTISLKIFI